MAEATALAVAVERVRAVAIQDAARLLAEDQNIAALAGAALAAQVGADLKAAGWPIQHARTVVDAYRTAIALEIEDAQNARLPMENQNK